VGVEGGVEEACDGYVAAGGGVVWGQIWICFLPLLGGFFSRPGLGPAADLLSYRATGVPATRK
jgi:hypothetical protein